ncbi:hypothetical protein [Winogradskyella immobilis]|uniref:YARHG domain-containing protein n=1 Tax=Winogradskyella immobilis TaxID=2816852 RepID=A0ABS8EQE9_9FLAO|nr:hypothetical protein [Winogradskyella immobilis]MCC1484527.1 hypothetical protein [Winogradskyella immobilis]MCG0016619.1 hypothetical protein [Winogradskyella immobilis]
MNNHHQKLFCTFFLFFTLCSFAQTEEEKVNKPKLFNETELLPIRLKYSRKGIKKETDDSTYIKSKLSYLAKNEDWETLDIKLRVRGNFRKKTCFFTPLKVKIKKEDAKGTVFKGEKKLKLVLPCLKESGNDDYVIKEYIAYKMYEVISPYYFKTRLLDIEYENLKKKDSKIYNLKGFFIEDDESVAKRFDGHVYKRPIYPKSFDDLEALRNAFFQCMIGNTDFSPTYQHNMKLLFIDKKFIPVPYDFDLSGLVNSSYAVVSRSRKAPLPIDDVTDRYFLGYKRDLRMFHIVKEEYIINKSKIMDAIEAHKVYFENKSAFYEAKRYIQEFYTVLEDEDKFKSKIIDIAKKI